MIIGRLLDIGMKKEKVHILCLYRKERVEIKDNLTHTDLNTYRYIISLKYTNLVYVVMREVLP